MLDPPHSTLFTEACRIKRRTGKKRGIKRSSVGVDTEDIPLGVITAAANHHDSPLLSETLDTTGELPEPASVHLDHAYDSEVSREILADRDLFGVISRKARARSA